MNRKPIGDAIAELERHLDSVARVYEWAYLMNYKDSKLFSRHFLRHFRLRPSKVLKRVRLQSIIKQLRQNGESCIKIAWAHSLPDEKALYNFTNRHLAKSPTQLKALSDKEAEEVLIALEDN
ncbi:AraC family transcriptional regulator [Fodinibius halophilus]|uniref:AraC family transcriptional regulator n=1 Tax=Fodinibius halophilus TaxID=1736908 RepID=A0A6M1T665_9BACT|nr:AraC family transcriptional regulator [Fodinibius halophilus]NGP88123.1 AraC family transcriptional regulator [Fodinibius halophilus]